MARMCCTCGHVISGLIGESPDEFTIVPRKLFYEMSLENENKKINFDSFIDKIYAAGRRRVVVCPKCGRHWITRIGETQEYYSSHVVEDNYSPSIKVNYLFDVIPQTTELKKSAVSLPIS